MEYLFSLLDNAENAKFFSFGDKPNGKKFSYLFSDIIVNENGKSNEISDTASGKVNLIGIQNEPPAGENESSKSNSQIEILYPNMFGKISKQNENLNFNLSADTNIPNNKIEAGDSKNQVQLKESGKSEEKLETQPIFDFFSLSGFSVPDENEIVSLSAFAKGQKTNIVESNEQIKTIISELAKTGNSGGQVIIENENLIPEIEKLFGVEFPQEIKENLKEGGQLNLFFNSVSENDKKTLIVQISPFKNSASESEIQKDSIISNQISKKSLFPKIAKQEEIDLQQTKNTAGNVKSTADNSPALFKSQWGKQSFNHLSSFKAKITDSNSIQTLSEQSGNKLISKTNNFSASSKISGNVNIIPNDNLSLKGKNLSVKTPEIVSSSSGELENCLPEKNSELNTNSIKNVFSENKNNSNGKLNVSAAGLKSSTKPIQNVLSESESQKINFTESDSIQNNSLETGGKKTVNIGNHTIDSSTKNLDANTISAEKNLSKEIETPDNFNYAIKNELKPNPQIGKKPLYIDQSGIEKPIVNVQNKLDFDLSLNDPAVKTNHEIVSTAKLSGSKNFTVENSGKANLLINEIKLIEDSKPAIQSNVKVEKPELNKIQSEVSSEPKYQVEKNQNSLPGETMPEKTGSDVKINSFEKTIQKTASGLKILLNAEFSEMPKNDLNKSIETDTVENKNNSEFVKQNVNPADAENIKTEIESGKFDKGIKNSLKLNTLELAKNANAVEENIKNVVPEKENSSVLNKVIEFAENDKFDQIKIVVKNKPTIPQMAASIGESKVIKYLNEIDSSDPVRTANPKNAESVFQSMKKFVSGYEQNLKSFMEEDFKADIEKNSNDLISRLKGLESNKGNEFAKALGNINTKKILNFDFSNKLPEANKLEHSNSNSIQNQFKAPANSDKVNEEPKFVNANPDKKNIAADSSKNVSPKFEINKTENLKFIKNDIFAKPNFDAAKENFTKEVYTKADTVKPKNFNITTNDSSEKIERDAKSATNLGNTAENNNISANHKFTIKDEKTLHRNHEFTHTAENENVLKGTEKLNQSVSMNPGLVNNEIKTELKNYSKTNPEIESSVTSKSEFSEKLSAEENKSMKSDTDSAEGNKDSQSNSQIKTESESSKESAVKNEFLNNLNKVSGTDRNNLQPKTHQVFTRPVPKEEIINEIQTHLTNGKNQSIEIKLDPKELGHIKIHMDVVDKVLHAKVEVENEQVQHLLNNNIDLLKQNLMQNGLQLNSFNISLSNPNQNKYTGNSKKREHENNAKGEAVSGDDEKIKNSEKHYGYSTIEYVA